MPRISLLIALLLLIPTVVIFSINSETIVLASDQDTVTVYFIDVGQGDSIFIDTSGLDVLIDGGTRTAGNIVFNFLQDLSLLFNISTKESGLNSLD